MSERYRTTGSGVQRPRNRPAYRAGLWRGGLPVLATTRPSRAAVEGGDLGRARDRV